MNEAVFAQIPLIFIFEHQADTSINRKEKGVDRVHAFGEPI